MTAVRRWSFSKLLLQKGPVLQAQALPEDSKNKCAFRAGEGHSVLMRLTIDKIRVVQGMGESKNSVGKRLNVEKPVSTIVI